MGIKIRIILMIIGIMVLVAVSTDFLSTTLNNKTFQEITQKNLDYRFRLIKKDFEYSIMIAKE